MNPRDIPDDVIQKIRDRLDGTCDSIGSALEALDLADEYGGLDSEIEDRLLDVGLECCRGCQWWMEPSELTPMNDDEECGYCDQCRE